mmetsp:Transcript_32786/g.77626  ORF Transcript_32786/g.77626 Transcript_32786/m.77626 type:complete len:2229 (-) Transcript_32786:40-6726(-)
MVVLSSFTTGGGVWGRRLLAALCLAASVVGGSALVESEQFLAEHNAYRDEVGVAPVTWDAGLAMVAQKWADRLALNHSCMPVSSSTSWRNAESDIKHPGWSSGGIGENIANFSVGNPAGDEVAGQWAQGKGSYIFGPFGDDCTASDPSEPAKTRAAYTQMIWATTKHIGCAMSNCSGLLIFVCEYHPAGNTADQLPFCAANKPPGMEECENITAMQDRPSRECRPTKGGCLSDGSSCSAAIDDESSACLACSDKQVCDTSDVTDLSNATCSCRRGCSGESSCAKTNPCPAGHAVGEAACCSNVDECAAQVSPCPNFYVSTLFPLAFDAQRQLGTCKDTVGSFYCGCLPGLEKKLAVNDKALIARGVVAWSEPDANGNQAEICDDLDECELDTDTCPLYNNTVCVNTFGSFECQCDAGYGKAKDGTCEDLDECTTRLHNCHPGRASCTNTMGSFSCACDAGFGTPDQRERITECVAGTAPATPGDRDSDGTWCVDVDECKAKACNNANVLYNLNVTCHAEATCWDTFGSYMCLCNEGLTGDGTTCAPGDQCAASAPPATSTLTAMAALCQGCTFKTDARLQYRYPFANTWSQCTAACLALPNCIAVDYNYMGSVCTIKLGAYSQVESVAKIESVFITKDVSSKSAWVRHTSSAKLVNARTPFDRSLIRARSTCAANAVCMEAPGAMGHNCTCGAGFQGRMPGERCLAPGAAGLYGTMECPDWSTAPAGSTESGDCVCQPGFAGDAMSPCYECIAEEYSAADPDGNETEKMCATCSDNSWSHPFSDAKSDCKCNSGYYLDGEAPEAPAPGPTMTSNGAIGGGSYTSPASNTINEAAIEGYLKEHNAYRRDVGAQDLVWDEDIAEVAQLWADSLKDDNSCKMKHSTDAERRALYTDAKHAAASAYSGENLAWAMAGSGSPVYSPRKVSGMWASEKADYAYGPSGADCTKPVNKAVGHYTQMVWAETQKIGCGVATCGPEKSTVWVCQYYPGGNYMNKLPFCKAGKPASMQECAGITVQEHAGLTEAGVCVARNGTCPSNGDCCSCNQKAATRRALPDAPEATEEEFLPSTQASEVALSNRRATAGAPAWCSRARGTAANPCTSCPAGSYSSFGATGIAQCTCWGGRIKVPVDPSDAANFECLAQDGCASSPCDKNAICSVNADSGGYSCACKKDRGYEVGRPGQVLDSFCYGFKYVDEAITEYPESDVMAMEGATNGDKLVAYFSDVNRQVVPAVYFRDIANLESQTAIDIPNTRGLVAFFTGNLRVTFKGTYEFCTNSSDGSILNISGTTVVNNDGVHAPRVVCGTKELTAGTHPIYVRYFANAGADKKLWAYYKGPDTVKQYMRLTSSSPHTPLLACTSGIPGASCLPADPFKTCAVTYDGSPGPGAKVNLTFSFETKVPVPSGGKVKLFLDGFTGAAVSTFAFASASYTNPGSDFFSVSGADETTELGCFANAPDARSLKATSTNCGTYKDADSVVTSVSMCQALASAGNKWGYCVQNKLCFLVTNEAKFATFNSSTATTCVAGAGAAASMSCYKFAPVAALTIAAGAPFTGKWDLAESVLLLTATRALTAGVVGTVSVTTQQVSLTAPAYGMGENSPSVRIATNADLRSVEKSMSICTSPEIPNPPELNSTVNPALANELGIPGDTETKIGIPAGTFDFPVVIQFRNQAFDARKTPFAAAQEPAGPVLRFSFPRGTVFKRPCRIALKTSRSIFSNFLMWLLSFRLRLRERGLAYTPGGGIVTGNATNSTRRVLDADYAQAVKEAIAQFGGGEHAAELRKLVHRPDGQLRRLLADEALELQEMKQHWYNSQTTAWVVIPKTSVDEATGVVSGDVPAAVFNNPAYDGLLCVMRVSSTVDPAAAPASNPSAFQTFYGSATFDPSVTATIFLRTGSRTGVVVLPNTFAASVTISLSSANHSSATTPVPSAGDPTAGSEVLSFTATLAALKSIQFTMAVDTLHTYRRAVSVTTVYEPRLFYLNKQSNVWIAQCSSTYSAPFSTVKDEVATTVTNSMGFNPTSGCANALLDDCSGGGGRLVVFNVPSSICTLPTVIEEPTDPEDGGIQTWQILVIIAAILLFFSCLGAVAYVTRSGREKVALKEEEPPSDSVGAIGFVGELQDQSRDLPTIVPHYPQDNGAGINPGQIAGLEIMDDDEDGFPAQAGAPLLPEAVQAQVGFPAGGADVWSPSQPYSYQEVAPDPPPRASIANAVPSPVANYASYQVDPEFWGEA